jgi:hypothetical protein
METPFGIARCYAELRKRQAMVLDFHFLFTFAGVFLNNPCSNLNYG